MQRNVLRGVDVVLRLEGQTGKLTK
jgi:hypothetical protein